MSKKIILASYLVWYCNEGFIQDDDNDIQQAQESVVMPSIDVTTDTMKWLFRVEMNKKYGEGKWKLEYFISIKECDAVEKEPDDPFPLNIVTNFRYDKTPFSINEQHVVFLGATGSVLVGQKSAGYHHGLKVLSVCNNFHDAHEFAKQWEKDNAK